MRALSKGVLGQGELMVLRCRKVVVVVRSMGDSVVIVEVVMLVNGDAWWGEGWKGKLEWWVVE